MGAPDEDLTSVKSQIRLASLGHRRLDLTNATRAQHASIRNQYSVGKGRRETA
jgi:hypothetical protein